MFTLFNALLLISLVTPLFASPDGVGVTEIFPRAAYIGGWPLGLAGTGGGCPSEASVACDGGTTLNQLCCPRGQFCTAAVITAYCCPTNSDCKLSVTNFPVCASASWVMYGDNSGGYFCCDQGQIGVNPTGSWGGLCVPGDQAVPSSELAKMATQVGATATSVFSTTTPQASISSPVTTPVTSASASASSKGSSLTTASSGSAASATTSTGADATTISAPGSASTSTTSAAKSTALSTQAIIGIAIGGIGLILLAAILFALINRNRRQQQQPQPYYAPAPSGLSGPSELHEKFQRKPVPDANTTSIYSAATPYNGSQISPSASPQPPQYRNLAAPRPYDPPVSPVSSSPYNSYAEMDSQGRPLPAELRADVTGR